MHDLIPSNQHCFTHDLILPAPIAMDNHDMLREIAADHVCIFAVMVIMESNLCESMWPLSSRAGVVSGRCQGKSDDVTADTKRNDTKSQTWSFLPGIHACYQYIKFSRQYIWIHVSEYLWMYIVFIYFTQHSKYNISCYFRYGHQDISVLGDIGQTCQDNMPHEGEGFRDGWRPLAG